MKELRIEASPERLRDVLSFIRKELTECEVSLQNKIIIVAEEIFLNIAHYAYNPNIGIVTIRIDLNSRIVIEFEDEGVPYNPLERDDPDLNINIEEREPGGLGIFIVKQLMDSVEYTHRDGKNIFTIRNKIIY